MSVNVITSNFICNFKEEYIANVVSSFSSTSLPTFYFITLLLLFSFQPNTHKLSKLTYNKYSLPLWFSLGFSFLLESSLAVLHVHLQFSRRRCVIRGAVSIVLRLLLLSFGVLSVQPVDYVLLQWPSDCFSLFSSSTRPLLSPLFFSDLLYFHYFVSISIDIYHK